MATTYFPNPIAAMPEPRFTAPQQDYSGVFQGALQSLTGVADNFRRKQASVQSAEKMAALLESEGLTSEANAYRQAAQAYDINFFSTPEQNERFNRSILNDTLKLLSDKKERDLRSQALAIQAGYQKGVLENQRMAIEEKAERGTSGVAGDRLNETRRNNQARIIGSRMDDVRAEASSLQSQLDDMVAAASAGTLSTKNEDVLKAAAQLKARQKYLGEEFNNLRAQLNATLNADDSGNSPEVPVSQFNPFYKEGNPLAGIIAKPEIQAQTNQANAAMLSQDPNLGRVGNVSAARPGSSTVTVLPDGTTKSSTTTPLRVDSAVKGLDPTAPKFGVGNLTK
jgi:hypothetical protein